MISSDIIPQLSFSIMDSNVTLVIMGCFLILMMYCIQSSSITVSKILDSIYDLAVCGFSVVDIVCDLLVTYDFYQKDHTVFFWISIGIFFLAQISYAVILTGSLEPTGTLTQIERASKYVVVFICVLPFGQFIPLFLLIQDSYLQQFNDFYSKHGYRSVFVDVHHEHLTKPKQKIIERKHLKRKNSYDQLHNDSIIDSDSDNDNPKPPEEDPLSDYIKQKTISHLGFIVEALVEAVPQSILQMVFIVIYGNYSSLNIFSILMSMIVVASKGTLLCYSIYRPSAIFNFLAFSVDIFGIFSVCAWLFCLTDVTLENTDYILFDLFPVWGPAYHYFNTLKYIYYIVFIEGFIGLGLLMHEIYRTNEEHPWKGIPIAILLCCGIILVAMPITLVALTVRLTLIPLLVLQSFNHTRKKSILFYTKLFSFFGNAPNISNLHKRILIANWRLAKLSKKYLKPKSKLNKNNKFDISNGITNWRSESIRKMAALNENNISLSKIYDCAYWRGLSTFHQIREIVIFLWKLQVWNILWKQYQDSKQYENKKNNISILDRTDFSYLRRDNNYNNRLRININNEHDGLASIEEMEFNEEDKQRKAQLKSSWEQIKLLIGWDHKKSKLSEKWDFIKNYDYKQSIKQILRDMKRGLGNIWRNDLHPWLINFFENRLPDYIWRFLSHLIYAILQDLINIWINIRRIYAKILVSFFCIKTKYLISICNEKKYEIILLDWRIPSSWWLSKKLEPNKWHRRLRNYFYNSDYGSFMNTPSYGIWFPPSYPNILTNNLNGYNNNNNNNNIEPIRVYIGEGIYTFILCFIYYFIHSPMRDFWTSYFWRDNWPVVGGVIFFIGIVPLLLFLALYSLFLPLIFMINSLYYYGITNNPHILQLVLTSLHCIILISMCLLIPYVWRFVYSDFHLYPFFNDTITIPHEFAQHVINVFDGTTKRNKIIMGDDSILGKDLGRVIVKFLPKWHIWNDQSNPPECEIEDDVTTVPVQPQIFPKY